MAASQIDLNDMNKPLKFFVIGKNLEILSTLKRVIENNEGWTADIQSDEKSCYKYLREHADINIVLLSAGLEEEFEKDIQKYVTVLDKGTKVITHYGGGSGLLKNEVYALFPELNT